MRSRTIAAFFLVLAGLATVRAPAFAQELRGRVEGVVRDGTGNVLPGVTVTVGGPALIRPQTTVTGGEGNYLFPALPSGIYSLVFELEGFQTLRREGIRVGLKRAVTVNIRLELAGLVEVVTVSGESPTVDVKSTTAGTSFTEDLLSDVPNARDIWASMAQAPGFQMTGYDVGGSHTGTQTGYITYGFEGQNKTLLEGINLTENQGLNAGYFDYGSFEEFQLGGSGNMGEQAGPGAMLNISVKSGGDAFHGQVYFDFENDATVSDNVPAELTTGGGETGNGFRAPANGLSHGNPITEQFDFNVGVGGPIYRGKAWFYGGFRVNNQFTEILGIDDQEAQSKLVNYTVKGSYQVNAKNHIVGFFNRRTKLQPLRGLSLTTPSEAAHFQESVNRPWKIEWTSTLSDNIYLDVQFSQWLNFFPLYPTQTQSSSVEGVPPGRQDLATGQRSGANSFYWERRVEKPQISGNLIYYLDDWGGPHHFKFGAEVYRERRDVFRFQPTNVFYRDSNGVPLELDLYNTPNVGTNDANLFSLYAQDSWTVGRRLTLNLGLRYERYKLGWPEQRIVPSLIEFFEPSATPATTVRTYNSVGPRLGFAWDVTGEGKAVWKAFYGRYYFNPSVFHSDKENPAGNLRLRFRFNDLNGNRVLDGPKELGDFVRSLDGAGFFTVDRDIEHAYGDEFSTHFEQELAEGLSVRASYIYKNMRNGWGLVDLNRVPAYTVPFMFHDPLSGLEIPLLDLESPDIPQDVVFTNPGRVGLPDLSGDYHTVGAALQRTLKDRWLLMTSFEHTWASDFRENAQESTSTLAVARHLVCGSGDFRCEDLWSPNARRFGKMESSWWNFKLVGRYLFPHEFGVSASYRFQSGFNYGRLISVDLPNAGTETVFAAPIDRNRGDSVNIIDVRVEKTFLLSGRWGQVTGMVDIFNLLNAGPVTNFRLASGRRYKEVIALLDPRIVRFGVRYEF